MVVKEAAWSETCLISFVEKGAALSSPAEKQIVAYTKDVNIEGEEKPIEQVPVLNGGRLVKTNPSPMISITFTGHPISAASEYSVDQMYDGVTESSWDVSSPIVTYANTKNRRKYRVSILWTDDTSATSAMGATASATNAYRYTLAEAYLTQNNKSYTGGILEGTWKFEGPITNPHGISNRRIESGEDTALAALASYNLTNYPEYSSSAYTWE
ncbi:MAG: hypothetical protein ACTSXD_08535 [Candidatus Heimdallarchaeaceae archaeon]